MGSIGGRSSEPTAAGITVGTHRLTEVAPGHSVHTHIYITEDKVSKKAMPVAASSSRGSGPLVPVLFVGIGAAVALHFRKRIAAAYSQWVHGHHSHGWVASPAGRCGRASM